MRDNKGFTLIELLAVIVVLAVILSIAIPVITSVIENATKSSFNSDAKMVLQAIEYKKLDNNNFNPLEVTKENMAETIGLSSANYSQVNISVTNDKIELILVGTDKWNGLTAYGSMKIMKVVNTEDYDIVPPSITIIGDNPKEVGKGSVYVDEGATATDLKDGEISISSTVIRNASYVVVDSINTSTFTTYTITYTAVDSQGNTASSVRRVNVVDKTEPVLTLLGDNPTTVNVNGVYIDSGATALDETDGDITGDIITTGNVNPSVVGTYTITYNVSDSSGNTSTPITRTVNVVDNIAPTVAFGTNGNSTYAKSGSTTVTVGDNVGVDENSLKYQWTTSTTAPTEASFTSMLINGGTLSTPTDATGTYYLWILGKDIYDNTIIIKSNKFNIDNTAPIITLLGDSSITINKGGFYSDAGATASDDIGGNITSNIVVTGNVNPSIIGTYVITYNVSDSSGNTSTPITRTINVIDVSAPIIMILGSNPVTVDVGSTYSDEGATALDDVDGNVTSKIAITGTVNPNVVGTYTITYTVKDNANNQAVSSRTVNVVDNTPPTVPTTMGMTYSDGVTNYINNTWTNKEVYMYGGILGSTDASGIAKYQISADNVTWVDYNYVFTNYMYGLGTEGVQYRYARAVDNTGNVSGSLVKTIKIDKTAPTTPTTLGMTYSDGITNYINNTWTNQAVYIYNSISGSTDASSGVARYQISSDNVNWVDYVYDNTQGLYALGSQGIQYRYARAIDATGNISGVLTKTIKIDSVNPVHTNWWWGPVTSSGASLYIQANDATSGLNRIQCPTSTANTSYTNWYWYNAIWDAGANAYRCDIQSSTFGYYGGYATHLYIYDNTGNGGYYNGTTITVPSPLVTLNIDSYADITNNFDINIINAYPSTPATLTYDAGTALFASPHYDNWATIQLKPIYSGINNIQFSLGVWIANTNFLYNFFSVILSDNTTIAFYFNHRSYTSSYYQYLPMPSAPDNFVAVNNITSVASNIGSRVGDGYVTYTINVDASGNLTMTSSLGHTYTTNIGSRKIISVHFEPTYMWWGNGTTARLDWIKYTQ